MTLELSDEEGELLTILLGKMCSDDISKIFRVERIIQAHPKDEWYTMGMLCGGFDEHLADAKRCIKFVPKLYSKLHAKYRM